MSCLRRLCLLGSLLASVAAVGCGDNAAQTQCGPGTALTDGQCVPDGTVICEQGTVFDVDSGTCQVDPSACAAGTVFLEGVCVPEDGTPIADHEEAAEPNDATGAGVVDVPALDASTSLHGCISPRAGSADTDIWQLDASGPALLEITADGVGGLAAAFIVVSDGAGLENYVRVGLNLVGDTSNRQLYLPTAGTYLLLMDDSRSLLTGEATGSDSTCYYTTIKQVALPAATALTVPTTTGDDTGDVRVLTYTPGQEGDIFDVTQTTDSQVMVPAFVLLQNDQFRFSAAPDSDSGLDPFATVGALAPTDTITVIVDMIQNYALEPQAYELTTFDVGTQALPTDGSAINLTVQNGDFPTAPWWERNYSYFDVGGAGELIHFDLTSSTPVTMRILRQDIWLPDGSFDSLATLPSGDAFAGEYVRFLAPGRYYFATQDTAGDSGDTYTLTATLTSITPTALTYETAITAVPLAAHGAGFHTFDVDTQDWIQVDVSEATDWGAAASVELYDLTGEGWLGGTYLPVRSGTQAPDDSEALGQITRGDTRDYLVRIEDTGTSGASPTYDLVIEERPHVALGMITAGTPITRTDMDPTAVGEVTRYLVTGTAGDRLTSEATPVEATSDIYIATLDTNETIVAGSDNELEGGAETVDSAFSASRDWIALEVGNFGTDPTNLDLVLNASPPPYAVTTGTLAYADACTGGTVLPAPFDGDADGEFSPQILPFALPFFGSTFTDVIVSADGFVSVGTTEPVCDPTFGCYANDAIPSANDPNGILAPYWTDVIAGQVCRLDATGSVTFQWTGFDLNTFTEVAFQVVLHDTGVVDFIYGSAHAADGSVATVGVENTAGDDGVQVVFDEPGVAPGTSFTLTPQ